MPDEVSRGTVPRDRLNRRREDGDHRPIIAANGDTAAEQ
jgi:hypothetical protein